MSGLGRSAGGPTGRVRSGLCALVLCLALPHPGWGGGRTMYGYEDDLGMLHLAPTRRSAQYKPLFQGTVDHATLVRLLRDKQALGGPPPRLPGLDARADLGPLPERGKRILQAAEPYLHTPYVLGGNTPAGVDCSGLTRAVLARFGCSLPRQSRLQAAVGSPIAADALAPGDLLFFSTNRAVGINHVGIYLGGDRMLHSSARHGGVTVDRLSGTAYARWFVSARRLPRLAVKGASEGRSGRAPSEPASN